MQFLYIDLFIILPIAVTSCVASLIYVTTLSLNVVSNFARALASGSDGSIWTNSSQEADRQLGVEASAVITSGSNHHHFWFAICRLLFRAVA